MEIVGDRKFVEVPGGKTHELPPLLVQTVPRVKRLNRVMGMAENIIEAEEMMPALPIEDAGLEMEMDRRKMDLAINLVEQYLTFVTHWQWGDSVLEWIRQCEMTFGSRVELRNLLRSDIWPHAARASFVTLLEDKRVPTEGVDLEKAVGLRLTFRQPPPIACCSDQFLFYLNSTLATTAYDTWSRMSPAPVSSLPPERFSFQVVNMSAKQ
ncbi:MAG TPA: hypothetical protein VKV15_01835 [Bryobacteraceae bacterium]|nr:hypothetical protein [Bryobacteraceae bacterium]